MSNKSLSVAVSNALKLGQAIGDLKNIEAQRESRLDAITKLITIARAEDKGRVWLAMLGTKVSTCPIRKAFADGVVAAGLSAKSASNMFGLVKYCVETGETFSFGLAKKLAEKNKPKHPTVGTKLTEVGEENNIPTVTVVPPNPPSGAHHHQVHTEETISEVVEAEGNNGPAVQKEPSAASINRIMIQNLTLANISARAALDMLRKHGLKLMADDVEAAMELLGGVINELGEATK